MREETVQVELLAVTQDSERVIEQAGRTCYMSQEHITDESAGKFVRMLVSRGHLSVLEHAYATFRVSGISRASTHQLVRHRLCSFSQRSQRYVVETADDFVAPPSIASNEDALSVFKGSVSDSKQAYEDLLAMGIPKEDARFVMPNATESEIVVSANFRELRHIVITRGSRQAQWEVRSAAIEMLNIMKRFAPNVFADLSINEKGYVEQQDIKALKGGARL
jgi:thymidylate synthase (FAD)